MDNTFCLRPPMGWNSYDYYDTTVTEEEFRENARFVAEHLKPYGWDYVVVDIQWYAYDTGTQQPKHQYIPFGKVEMDEYGRLLPCPDKFPSSVGGKGFAPLAEYVHSLGLRFGIHIMRGIPRMAAHLHLPVLGTDRTANELADPASICFWNPDMYGLRPNEPGAQAYYDSIFELYASWGVDFVKCDDICRMDMPSAREETRMLHEAIERCGRPMVFSLSPGPARIEQAEWYEKHANMWRVTDDLWDRWGLVHAMFERCDVWQSHVKPGCWPDCDMLPLGRIARGFGEERDCELTKPEQESLMTLWCIFRSPLMLGACPTLLDEWTLSLLTNEGLLRMQQYGAEPKQLWRDETGAAWTSRDEECARRYLAVFNFKEEPVQMTVKLPGIGEDGTDCVESSCKVTNVLTGQSLSVTDGHVTVALEPHGAAALWVVAAEGRK